MLLFLALGEFSGKSGDMVLSYATVNRSHWTQCKKKNTGHFCSLYLRLYITRLTSAKGRQLFQENTNKRKSSESHLARKGGLRRAFQMPDGMWLSTGFQHFPSWEMWASGPGQGRAGTKVFL